MDRFAIKKVACALCLLSTLFISAEEIESRVSALESRMGAVKTRTAKGTVGAKMATARPLTDGYGFFGTLDLLCWQAKEAGSEFVLKSKEPTTAVVKGAGKHAHFDWGFGFRLGGGYLFEHDEWDTAFSFTWFQADANNRAHASSNGLLFPQWGMADETLGRRAKIDWDLGYYVFDVELARHFFVSKFLALRPLFGFEIAWINQHFRFKERLDSFQVQPHTQFFVRNKNDFFGIGPLVGVDTNWFFNSHWSLFGNLRGSLLVGEFDVREKEKFSGNGTVKFSNTRANLNGIIPVLKAILGLQWECDFNETCNHVALKLGYEFQYLWNLNQMTNVNSVLFPEYVREAAALSINGLTFEARLDF